MLINISRLGKKLSKEEQKKVNGGEPPFQICNCPYGSEQVIATQNPANCSYLCPPPPPLWNSHP